ncbi:MAG: PEP-CTERM sorting domain-containing protein [Betaproteobacteria bacterium]|nr:PEP-CTERM sorting domain-containing protein [Betaproteobacteria bacterium]
MLRNEGNMVIGGSMSLNYTAAPGSGRIENAAGAVIDVQSFNQSLYARSFTGDDGSDARIDNAGTFRKSTTGTYNIGVPFYNTGTVEVLAGRLNFTSFANGGSINVGAGTTFEITDPAFVNTGTMKGNGTLVAPAGGLVNAGVLSPGNSPGHLTISGDLVMDGTGSLNIELNGLSDFDLLTVTGTADLAGELRVSRLAGYTPAVGDSFAFLTFADRAGTRFDSVSFDGFGVGVQFDVAYGSQDVTLTVAAVPEPGTWTMLMAGLGLVALRRRRR